MLKHLFLFFLFIQVTLQAQGYLCAIGGGSENYNDWSDAPYGWIVQKSDSGKIIIISDANATSWLPTYFISLGADTAYNKTISSINTANLQATYDELITAKAIFIRGGDQWNYIRLWKGTKTEEALKYVFQNGGVIGGTSAGAAVLGDVDFSAKSGSVYPDEALINPFNNYMQFEDNFLNLIQNVIFDTHFIERGRHARLMAMLYNRKITTGRNLMGIGIDDMTAVGIDKNGIAEVFGSGAVSFFFSDDRTLFSNFTSGIYTIEQLNCNQLTKGWKFDIPNKQIAFIPPTAKTVDTSRTWQYPNTNIYLTGSSKFAEQLNSNFVLFKQNNSAGNYGIITHPGYQNKLDSLLNFLNTAQISYRIIPLTNSNLNDTSISNSIANSNCFVITGDSLNIISLLNDTSTLSGKAFNTAITLHKEIFYLGHSGKTAGEFYIDNLYKDMYAGYRGRMTNKKGLNIFGDLIIEPALFDNSDYYENKVSSVLWGMMLNRKRLGVYQHGNSMAYINSSKKSIKGFGTIHPLFVDASQTTLIDSSVYRASGSVGTRQLVAMNNLRYSYTNSEKEYFIESGKFESGTGIKENKEVLNNTFVLSQNYPNPFNPATSIIYQINREGFVTLKVYDILGKELMVLVNEYLKPGSYKVDFTAKNISSGIYFYTLNSGNNSETKSMVLLK